MRHDTRVMLCCISVLLWDVITLVMGFDDAPIVECDVCRGMNRPLTRMTGKGMRSNWIYKFVYGTCLPVMSKFFIPCILIVILNVVIYTDGTEEREDNMYDTKTSDRMIRSICIIDYILESTKPFKYLYLYEAKRITYGTNERILVTISFFSALSSCTFVFVHVIFKVFQKNSSSHVRAERKSVD
jgi:hypothetical protein